MAKIRSLWFAIRIWFLMEWTMAKRGFTSEQKSECWKRHEQLMDEIRAELEQMIARRNAKP